MRVQKFLLGIRSSYIIRNTMVQVICSTKNVVYQFSAVFEGVLWKDYIVGLKDLISPEINTPDFLCFLKYCPRISACDMHISAKSRFSMQASAKVSVCDENNRTTPFERSAAFVCDKPFSVQRIAVLPAIYQASARLIFYIEVTVYRSPTKSENISIQPLTPVQMKATNAEVITLPATLRDDVLKIWLDPRTKDVNLLVDGRIAASAHKSVLSIRSEVFRTMFASQMSEALSGDVHITDVSAGAVVNFVRFIYTDNITDEALRAHITDLYKMARKYDVFGLETVCENCLIANLEANNVIHILQFSDLYDATRLRCAVLNFIAKNNKLLVQNKDFWAHYYQYWNATVEAADLLSKHVWVEYSGASNSGCGGCATGGERGGGGERSSEVDSRMEGVDGGPGAFLYKSVFVQGKKSKTVESRNDVNCMFEVLKLPSAPETLSIEAF